MLTVVGVVADVRHHGLVDFAGARRAGNYLGSSQHPARTMFVAVRTTGARALDPSVRREIAAVRSRAAVLWRAHDEPRV